MGSGSKRQKHIPLRTCVACKQKMDKRQLTRVVRTSDTGIVIDLTGKRNGRGAYLCGNADCWEKAVTDRLLEKSLKTHLTAEERQVILDQRPT